MGDLRRNLCWDLSTFENFMEEGALLNGANLHLPYYFKIHGQ